MVDPVGACVGARGSRVRNITNELRSERIDVVPYSDDPVEFIPAALQPARVREVRLDEEEGIATVIVHDQQLSLAIGKEGQNARLAARLTGWRIDIRSENEGQEDEVVEEAWTDGDVVVDEKAVARRPRTSPAWPRRSSTRSSRPSTPKRRGRGGGRRRGWPNEAPRRARHSTPAHLRRLSVDGVTTRSSVASRARAPTAPGTSGAGPGEGCGGAAEAVLRRALTWVAHAARALRSAGEREDMAALRADGRRSSKWARVVEE